MLKVEGRYWEWGGTGDGQCWPEGEIMEAQGECWGRQQCSGDEELLGAPGDTGDGGRNWEWMLLWASTLHFSLVFNA